MSNIYLNATIEKNWRSQNFDFLSLKNLSPSQFWGAPAHNDNFERNYDVLKSNSPCIFLDKNINFNIDETELKM